MKYSIFSPIDGEVLSLSTVPDEAFSSGMLGEGFAVKPSGETVCAPASGVIGTVSENGHAYSIASDIGDLLVHIGVDTVHLEGVFEPMVKPGQKVADIGRDRIRVSVFADRADHSTRGRANRLTARLDGKPLPKHPR